MLSELVRVAKPGGRVAVLVRAIDIPLVVNVPLRPELKTKAQIPRGFIGAQRCADARQQFAASEQPDTAQARFAHGAISARLAPRKCREWRTGMAQAVADGTYFIASRFTAPPGQKAETPG